jgi:hypothetical protein
MRMSKIATGRSLTALAVLATLWSAIHLLVASSGLVIPAAWGGWAVALCGVICVVAAVVTWRTPRQRVAFLTNLVMVVPHLLFWSWFISALAA